MTVNQQRFGARPSDSGDPPAPSSIVGFHVDPEGDWVAELDCGHQQHVRHRPPFEDRPWVMDVEGRRARLGRRIDCRQCEDERTSTGSIRDQPVSVFLARLAQRGTTPAGGCVAALGVSIGASLVSMVLDDGPATAAERAIAIRLKLTALQLVEDDAAAYDVVMQARGLLATSDVERRTRSEAITTGLVGATETQARVVELAVELVYLVERALPMVGGSRLADLHAAVAAARAAIATGRLNVDVNTGGHVPPATRSRFLDRISAAGVAVARADDLDGRINRELGVGDAADG